MRKLTYGRPPDRKTVGMEAYLDWIADCLHQIRMTSFAEPTTEDAFSVTNHTDTRSLDVSTATLTDLKNVVATLISDGRKRGAKHTT